jgi:hypothetical protein
MVNPTPNPYEAPVLDERSEQHAAARTRRERFPLVAFVIAVVTLSANFLIPLTVVAFFPEALGRIDRALYSVALVTLIIGVLCCAVGALLGEIRLRVACLTLLVPYGVLLQEAIGVLTRLSDH